MIKFLALAIISLLFTKAAGADPCIDGDYTRSSEAHLKPGSIPIAQLASHLNSSPYTHGIKVSAIEDRGDLLLDIIDYPGDTPIAAGLMIILQVGRLMEESPTEIFLVDGSTRLYSFDGAVVRTNGCRSIWGTSGSGSPLPMFVDLMGNVSDMEGREVVPSYSGSWLTNMNTALEAFNEEIAPDWIFPVLEG